MRKECLIAALALLLCGTSSAIAGAANTPRGDWIVGPINAASSSGVGYCSMKNDYRDGHTLVFARDAEGSNSLAIDFHKKVLETGGQYNVILHVGPLERRMQAIAATSSVIIIQMGLDRDFYGMLRRKPSLLVDFQTSRMSFGLDGTQDGLAALTTCAQAVGSHKHFAQTKIPLKAMTDEEYLPAVEPAAGAAPVMPPAAFPQQAPVVPQGQAFTGNLGLEAAQATLQDQLDALKAENRKLLLENQRVAESLQAAASPPVSSVSPPVSDAQPADDDAAPPMLAVPPPLVEPSPSSAAPRADNVTAALAAAQQGIQQALEASQAQAEDARRQADMAAENARLKVSLEAAQAQAAESRRQAAILAENAKLRQALAAEQLDKQRALEAARQQAADAERQASVVAENARLKASLAAAEQEKQRAFAAAQAAAAAAAQAEARRQAAIEAEAQKARVAAHDEPPVKLHQLPSAPVAAASKPAAPRVALQVVDQPDDFLQELLTQSHVTGTRDPRNPGAYTWSVGGIEGMAEEQDLTEGSLADAANDYVLQRKAGCRGDFAHTVSAIKKVNGAEIMEGELACMNGVNDAAAAVLFIVRNGRLAIVSHEGPPSRMEKSLSSRDEMVSVISQ